MPDSHEWGDELTEYGTIYQNPTTIWIHTIAQLMLFLMLHFRNIVPNTVILKNSPSKIQTVLSRLHVARYAPLLDHATLFTSFSCPSSVAMHSKSDDLLLQMDVVPSKLVAARSLPHGDQLTQRIVRWWAPSSIVLQTQRFSPKQIHEQTTAIRNVGIYRCAWQILIIIHSVKIHWKQLNFMLIFSESSLKI